MRFIKIMKRVIVFFIVFLPLSFFHPALVWEGNSSVKAQDRNEMAQFQTLIAQQMELVYNAPTDNERYHASEAASQLFDEALRTEDSFKWQWDFGSRVSVLTSKDRRFKIITWPVVRDDGEYECFGFVQSYNEEEEVYDVFELHDKSDEIVNREESVLGPDNWLGAVYQELIQSSHEGKTYYTLLGWTGVDNLTQRKVIEPITFKHNSSRPQFGQALFRRERNLRRVVLEYSKSAMVNLRYENQFVRTVENKRIKKKGSKRPILVQENHDSRQLMILFDEVAPQIPGMEGLFQYYVPTGTELAYVFTNGRWDLRDNAQGRVDDERLNKPFAPIEKSAPVYTIPK